ncbi:hypothetical protein [Archangium sp.]|uniref:NACHT domain-containing protein n=1 Tax=Archangium sp. TaxID=1872627 RepID=UPI00286C6C8B|nr:hypothetical protein [Archangium sp.]
MVVLLGEAGIGKSFELVRWCEARRLAGAFADFIDLRIESVDGLVERWRRKEVISRWLGGVGDLELFLDGVDEFPAGIRSFTASLKSFIDGIDAERLRLRVTSRPGAWSEDLTRVVAPVDQNGNVVVLSLLPLEEEAAYEAAGRLGVPDAERFLEWVRDRKAESLASRPLTLKMLCDSLAARQQPPASRAELFERYLNRLFQGHKEQARDRALTAQQRLEVASRIAAATLFAKRPLIVDFDQDASAELVVGLEELVGGAEGTGPGHVAITRAALQESIETGPFVRLDHGTFLWSSRAYEEYLGARYLARRAQSTAILDAVLVNAADPKRRTVPALRGAIGWLADLKPGFWRDLAKRDPRALIEAETSVRSPDERAFLVDAWLKGIEAGAFAADAREMTERLGFLAYDGISGQLDDWLDTTQHKRDAVWAATYLAGTTAASGCSSRLIALVEQPWAEDPGRVSAHRALDALREFMRAKRLSPEVQARVLDLCRRVLDFDESLDPDDNLLGVAVDILWPEHLTTTELLSVLRVPYRRSHFGSYQAFLLYRFPKEVELRHLAMAIRWVAKEQDLADTALETLTARAIDHLDDAQILHAVLEVLFDDDVSFKCPEALRVALAARASSRAFVGAALSIGEAEDQGPTWVGYKLGSTLGIATSVVLGEAWTGLAEAKESADRERFAKAVEDWTAWREEAPVARLLTEGPRYPELARALEEIRKFGDEPSTVVNEVRRRHDEELSKRARPEREPMVLDPPLEERVRVAIDAARDGSSSTFWKLLHELHRRPTDRAYAVDWHVPVWKTHGWGSTDDEQRDHIIEAAHAFLLANDPQTDKWLGMQQMRLAHAYMGVAAVRLLHTRGHLADLGDDILACWAPALVYHDDLFQRDKAFDEAFNEILSLLMARVPHAVAATWVAVFEGYSGQPPYRAFAEGWCPAVRDAFVASLRRQTEPTRLGRLLVELLRKDVDAAHAFAAERLSWIEAAPGSLERERGRQVAFALLRSGAGKAAAALDYLEGHGDDAREVLLCLGQDILLSETLVAGWSVDVVGRFVELLAIHFPPLGDQEFDGAYWMGPEERIREQRNRCLNVLRELAGVEGWAAVDELTRLERAFPDWKAVSYHRMEAVDRAGVASWSPPPPAEVLRIICEGVSTAHGDGARRLEHFLCERFSDSEIRMLVRRLPEGNSLEAQLIGAMASRAQLASSVVEVLGRAGRIDEDIFSALLEERTALADEIRAIAGILNIDISSRRGVG